mgnify:CR=1 FL=1
MKKQKRWKIKKSETDIIKLWEVFVASVCEKTCDVWKKDKDEGEEGSKHKGNDGAKYIEKKTDWYQTIRRINSLYLKRKWMRKNKALWFDKSRRWYNEYIKTEVESS